MTSSHRFCASDWKLQLRPPQQISASERIGSRIFAGQLASSQARVSERKPSSSVIICSVSGRRVTKVTSLSVRARASTGMKSCKVVGMGKGRCHAAKPSTSIPIRKAKSERQENGFFRPRIDIRKPTSPRKVELDIAAAPRVGEAADDLQQGFGPE